MTPELSEQHIEALLKEATSAFASPGNLKQTMRTRLRDELQFPTLHEPTASKRFLRLKVAVAIAASVFVLLTAGLIHWSRASGVALADVLEHVRTVRSLTFKVTAQPMPNLPPQVYDVMLLEPGKARQTMPGGTVLISNRNLGKCLVLQPAQKRAILVSLTGRKRDEDAEGFVEELKALQDGSEERLGKKEIDDKTAIGFHISGDPKKGWDWTIWADEQTGLPIRVEVELGNMGLETPIVMSDFAFNVELDDSLFSMTPPAGYTVQEMQVPISDPTEEDLVEGLRTITRLTDGTFPPDFRIQTVVGIVIDSYKSSSPRDAGHTVLDAARDASKTARAHSFVTGLNPDCDWHYAGKDVRLGEGDKPVCWWRPRGSQTYRVIYGDLSVRPADASELPSPP